MSAALLERAPASTIGATGALRGSRSAFPVGARFPRRVTSDAPVPPSAVAAVSTAGARIFPVGARFPRRVAADVAAYLAELEISGGPIVPTRPVHPVGARFPLR